LLERAWSSFSRSRSLGAAFTASVVEAFCGDCIVDSA
jgi:hypothetical protein